MRNRAFVPALFSILLLLLTANVPAPKLGKNPLEEKMEGISVIGPPYFRDRLRSAFYLLSTRAPRDLRFVQTYVKTVWMGAHSSMHPGKYMIEFSPAVINDYSTTWLAASITHEACHGEQWRNAKNESLDQQAKELECIRTQIETLKKIGAPESEINYARMADGKHYDVNKDGKFTMEDYWQHNW